MIDDELTPSDFRFSPDQRLRAAETAVLIETANMFSNLNRISSELEEALGHIERWIKMYKMIRKEDFDHIVSTILGNIGYSDMNDEQKRAVDLYFNQVWADTQNPFSQVLM